MASAAPSFASAATFRFMASCALTNWRRAGPRATPGFRRKFCMPRPLAMVLDYIAGRTYDADDVRENRKRCVASGQTRSSRHRRAFRGPTLSFNVFHIIRDYAHTLVEDKSRMAPQIAALCSRRPRRWSERSGRSIWSLGIMISSPPISLMTARVSGSSIGIMRDGIRRCSILADSPRTMASTPPTTTRCWRIISRRRRTDALRHRFKAMLCASLLREALWSIVSESRSTIDFDYVSYTDENLRASMPPGRSFSKWSRA